MAAETQESIGRWSDELMDQGRNVLADGTLDSDGYATRTIRAMVVCHRSKISLQAQIDLRMKHLRRGTANQARKDGDQ